MGSHRPPSPRRLTSEVEEAIKRAATVDLDDMLGSAPHQSLAQLQPRSGLRNPRGLGSDCLFKPQIGQGQRRSLTDCDLNVSARVLAAIVARGAPLDGAKNIRLSLLTARMAKPPIGLVWRQKATFFT